MAQNYTQKAFINGKWVDQHPKTAAPQVITDAQHRFLTDAQITALEGKQDALGYTPENTANKNKAGGYAGLDDAGRLPLALIPALLEHNKGYFADEESLKAAHPTASAGDFAIVGATDTVWIYDADLEPAAWIDSASRGTVLSVNGKTGAVTITWDDLSAPDATTAAKGVVQLSSATDSDSETVAATPKAVKAAMAAAAGKASVTVSDTAPENPAEGDFWFDTSET